MDMRTCFTPVVRTKMQRVRERGKRHVVLEERGSVVCIFFDLCKAFDSLPHYLIIDSLARVDICGTLCDWFGDYLSGHSRCVDLDGST